MAPYVGDSPPQSTKSITPNAAKANEHGFDDGKTPRNAFKRANAPKPLQTSGLGNLQPTRVVSKHSPDLEDMLHRLRINDSRKATPIEQAHASTGAELSLDELVSNLDNSSRTLRQQESDLKTDSEVSSARTYNQSSGSELCTPATDIFDHVTSAAEAEIERVKKELEAARSLIHQQQAELDQTRALKHTMDQALSTPSDAEFPHTHESLANVNSAFNAAAHPFKAHANSSWNIEDSSADTLPPGYQASSALVRGRTHNAHNPAVNLANAYGQGRDTRAYLPEYSHPYEQALPFDPAVGAQRTFSIGSTTSVGPRYAGNNAPDALQYGLTGNRRGNFGQLRSDSTWSSASNFGETLSPVLGGFTPGSLIGQLPQVNGTISSPVVLPRNYGFAAPTVTDMPLVPNTNLGTGYLPSTTNQTYVTPLEPMNYRRLLEKSVSCDWKYIVDKIVCNNDQQASIFLQQKLKVGTAEQKFEIVEAIINQAYPLMINRFGNFLVQRCFEHGTPEQVVAIADAIHGNVISLSMDPFGCHVIQKAFDSVPENHKADMVHELLRRIPDTVIHRYACHVWQKLFELRWSNEPPQIMTKVNDALHNMWHEVALGETGSLVVQNIFENCVEEEKRPAIDEVIHNIDLIAHGQFGNWCIQHLCEHGSPPDKRRVIDHILCNAYSYSIDQYASKVVEKCLKIGGVDFLDRYLTVITTSHPDRPRIPLIDIAGDQYGNYLIQWILMNTHQQQREQVAVHIRKHMVSLRGSKFGSRVAMLCCNPASATRPGTAQIINPFGAPGQPRNQFGRYR